MKRYAISDIHGCLKTFTSLLDQINPTIYDEIYILGDMVDRGPDSKGVIDFILELNDAGFNIKCIKGNHEDMMLKALDGDREMEETWASNGAYQTIKSYGNIALIPHRHYQFLSSLPTLIELDDMVLVHAGLNFGNSKYDRLYNRPPVTDPIAQTSDDDRMWERDFSYDEALMKGKYLINGHTPMKLDFIKDCAKNKKRIFIDGACVFGKDDDDHYGYLVALDLDTKDVFYQKKID